MAALCRLGFAVLLGECRGARGRAAPVPSGDTAPTGRVSPVNYRGSLGFGQASISSLLSRVGVQDVEDTQVRGAGLGVLVVGSAGKTPTFGCWWWGLLGGCRCSGANDGVVVVRSAGKTLTFRCWWWGLLGGSQCSGADGGVLVVGAPWAQLAVEQALCSEPLDPHRLALLAGSHGAFIALHLLAREPERYQACALRSPVSNLPALLGTSDIPDW